MNNKRKYEFLLSDLSSLNGVGIKTSNLLKKKNINNIFDLLWKLPKSSTDRSLSSKIKDLRIGENQTVTVLPQKYFFPRVRNLPNKVLCKDETGEMDCVFFNSHEGYIRKILPLNKNVTISGKIGRFKNKYQLTNPKYISEDSFLIKQEHNTYSLTEGISEKIYNKIIKQIIDKLPILDEWHSNNILKKFNYVNWNESIKEIHKSENIGNYKSNFYQRLAYDELLANQLALGLVRSQRRSKPGRILAGSGELKSSLLKELPFTLTGSQELVLKEIFEDLKSDQRMLRLLQGDVGSGKTIIALLSMIHAVESGAQAVLIRTAGAGGGGGC